MEEGTVFLTGIEAIVRLLVEKQRRDGQQAGTVNQTYVSGYEGSPLGGLDLEIVSQLEILNRRGRTVHQFGINEKTAASAMLGTQYAPSADVDAFWYGKAHGTMWIPDEVWLANLAGTSGSGSMVLLCGEDHRSKSSVSPGSSDWVLRGSMVPIFYPASVEEILSLGMHAIHLSRYLGVVTALKLATPLCDGAGTVRLGDDTPRHPPAADRLREALQPDSHGPRGAADAEGARRGETPPGRGVRPAQQAQPDPSRQRFRPGRGRHHRHRQVLPRRQAGPGDHRRGGAGAAAVGYLPTGPGDHPRVRRHL